MRLRGVSKKMIQEPTHLAYIFKDHIVYATADKICRVGKKRVH